METELYLTTSTTQEDLEAYRRSKNIDLATKLPT